MHVELSWGSLFGAALGIFLVLSLTLEIREPERRTSTESKGQKR